MSCSIIWIFEGIECLTLISTSWLCVWAVQWSVQDWSDTVLTNSVQSSVQLSTITEFSDPEYQYLNQHKNANTSLPFYFSRQLQFCFRSTPIPNATCDLGSVKFTIVNVTVHHVITCILSHLVWHRQRNNMRTCANAHAVMQSSCRFVKCPVSSVRCGCEASSLISLSSLLARS